jgi:hypothetical protein
MIRIGMIGEYPSDTKAIANLLNKKYADAIEFFPLIRDVHGSNLENQKIKHLLRREYQIEQPDFVLFIRDLDGLEHHAEKLIYRKACFTDFNSVIDKKGILLLNIFELEALLLTDIEAVNKYYGAKIDHVEDCMIIESPKEFLKKKISSYSTGHNPDLFGLLDYKNVIAKCRYYKKFDEDFEKIVLAN